MNQLSLHNEPELLQLLKNGSEKAFTLLFNAYRGNIYSTAFTFLNSATLAEEVVQDVFLKMWLKRTEMGEVRHLQDYLFIMTRNIIFDRLKKMSYEAAARQSLTGNETSADETEYLARFHQCQQLLKEAIDRLTPQQKKIYILAKEQGLSHEDIAAAMQLSKYTVKKHMALALNAIRKYLYTHLHYLAWLIALFSLPAL